MKVTHAANNVLASGGLQQTGGFKIAATGHAFKMLSSGLYSDKVRAVLREIGCNAADAHIEAGCPERPFRVKLPNALDEQFYIQDWGPGLAHDAVMNLYTTYFASTKQTSNDFTGAFGLGSKSPFSYIDSFNVVSAHGGKKRTYALYLANDGAPTVSLMSEEDAEPDWQTGVRVGFAVKSEDREEFKAKAQDVFKWFKVIPEVRGSPPIVPIQYRSDREEFRLLKDGGGPFVLMGNVAYPLDFSKCGVDDPYGNKGVQLRNYSRCTSGFVLVMPIGSVTPAASREALQYNPEDIRALQERLDLSMRKLGNDVVERLEAALKGGWTELCKVRDIIDQGLPGTLRYDFAVFGKALGLDKAKVDQIKPFLTKTEIEVPKEAGEMAACRLVYVKPYGRGSGKPTYSWISEGVSQNGGKAKIAVSEGTVVAYGTCGHAVPRGKLAINKGEYKQLLIFCRPSSGPTIPAAEIEHEARKVAGLLGGVPVIELKTLEAPPKGPSRPKRPKNWQPSLPATQEFTCYDMDKKVQSTLGALKDQLFACYVQHSHWGNVSKKHRLYEKSDKDDDDLDWDAWTRIWGHYVTIQSKLKLAGAPSSYAVVRAKEIKDIRLVQLGWTRVYDAVKKYVGQKELADELRPLIQKRVLVAPTELARWNQGWMSSIACLHYKNKLSPRVRDRLQEVGLMDMVQKMVDATRAKKEEKTPPEITAYQELVKLLSLPNDLAKDIQDAATVEDVDNMFIEQFPRTSACSVNHLTEFDTKGDLTDYLLFVLGRQT